MSYSSWELKVPAEVAIKVREHLEKCSHIWLDTYDTGTTIDSLRYIKIAFTHEEESKKEMREFLNLFDPEGTERPIS